MALWLKKLAEVVASDDAAMLITVLATKGSIPRETGTKMVVSRKDCVGTVGGGNLEYQCIAMAQARLADNEQTWTRKVHRFPLGASLGQCCGGLVIMLLEYIDHYSTQWIERLSILSSDDQDTLLVTPLYNDSPKYLIQSGQESDALVADKEHYFVESGVPDSFPILLFGAGHVGRALINVLAGINCTIRWVDHRVEQFPAVIPANTQAIITDTPEDEIAQAPANTCFIVMTHSHQLDQQVCESILRREEVRFCGLIGSLPKKRKFEQRLQAKGFSQATISKLTCPIGIAGIVGKEPGVIAVSVVAQLLRLLDQ